MAILPVASTPVVRAYAWRLAKQYRAKTAAMLGLYALASVMALIPAWVIGSITNAMSQHHLSVGMINKDVIWLILSSIAYALFSLLARRRSYILGEEVFAQLREEFLESVLQLPLVEVERAGTGDLLSRTSNDVESLARTVRFALPEWLVAIIQTLITLVAMLLVSPIGAVATLVSTPFLFFSTRHYLRYATPGYRRERISYATMMGTIAETAEGARTIDALRLGDRQVERVRSDIRESFYSEMYTLLMRLVWFPIVESSYALATGATLAWCGFLAFHHVMGLGAATPSRCTSYRSMFQLIALSPGSMNCRLVKFHSLVL